MNSLFFPVVFTSNILGSFSDPFEFAGDYGDKINSIREYVFEQVVSKEALANNLTDLEVVRLMTNKNPSMDDIQHYRQRMVDEAIEKDLQHGPTFEELVPIDLILKFLEKQRDLEESGFRMVQYLDIAHFIHIFQNRRPFSFFRHASPDFLALDKVLRDNAAREGRNFDLPILSSSEQLKGKNGFELKVNLLESLFRKENLEALKHNDKLSCVIEKLDPDYAREHAGNKYYTEFLNMFSTPVGQLFYYWMYQSLNLHLIAQSEAIISQINKVKQIFAETLGNPQERALSFKNKLLAANASVVFTQESDAIVPRLLEEAFFHSVSRQNPADGTFVFLRKDHWEPSYQIIPIENYAGYEKGRLNVILATSRETGEKFLLASSHGNSTRSADGRLQIEKIVEKYHQLAPEHKDLQLVIGIDANTKSVQDVRLLRDHLESLGLVATNTGPTTIKKRMVTAQHTKAGRFAVDEEDYVIVLRPENGGLYKMTDPTIGFKKERPDPAVTLPNKDNPSDHYAIGVTLRHTP